MFQLILLWLILIALLFCLSLIKLRQSNGKIHFIYSWAFPLGAFVWEDLLVFSLLNILATIITLFFRDVRIFYLFFLMFWVVRSLGETIYWMLQQFLEPNKPPHNEYHRFDKLKKAFGNLEYQSFFILLQVMYQAITVIALVLIVYLLVNWNLFKPWL
jgi:hypothetical protein